MAEQSPGEDTGRRGLTGGAIASLGGVGLLAIFMIQNTEDVQLDFLFWSFHVAGLAAVLRDGAAGGTRVVWTRCAPSSSAPQGPSRGPPRLKPQAKRTDYGTTWNSMRYTSVSSSIGPACAARLRSDSRSFSPDRRTSAGVTLENGTISIESISMRTAPLAY